MVTMVTRLAHPSDQSRLSLSWLAAASGHTTHHHHQRLRVTPPNSAGMSDDAMKDSLSIQGLGRYFKEERL